MHKSEHYGKILLKQKYKQNEQQVSNFASLLAKFLPYDLPVIESALIELLSEKVLQIDGDHLVQKRMVKDGDISDKRAEAGKEGGKKSLGKKKKDFAQAKPQAKPENEDEVNTEDVLKDKEGLGGKKEKFKIKTITAPELESFFDVIGMSNHLTKDQVNLGWSEFSEANSEFDFDDITHAKRMFTNWIQKKKFNNGKPQGTTTNNGRSQTGGRTLSIK